MAEEKQEEEYTSKIDEKMWTEFDLALKDRQDWDSEQEDYYVMRYEGMGRPKLPYANAPDIHYPLIDEYIEKLKPFFVQQIYTPSVLATFVGYPDDGSQDTDAEMKFDYELKQRSNFELEIHRTIDKMLQCGTGIMKNYWDEKEKCLYYCSVDPNFCIVPSGTEGIQGTDWFIHVIHMSEATYRRNKTFRQDDDFIKQIKGRGTTQMDNLKSLKQQREGITFHANSNMIVIWEIYTRNEKAGWDFDTISPILGWNEGIIRSTQKVPYTHNELPFTEYRLELAEPGFYSSRGIAALLKAHELSLDKLWNYLFQYLDFSAMPTFDNDGTSVSNSTNLQKEPGLILPPGITQSETVKAPVDFIQQMQMFRSLAESRVAMPDLSASEHLSGQRGSRGDVTATQISAIVGQSNQGNDMRSRIWKLQVAPGFRQSWSLLTQYKYTEYRNRNYTIQPSGSADSWDKAARAAQAMSLYTMGQQDPNIDKEELTKHLLENNGPELVKKLYRPQPAPQPPPPTPLEQVEAMSKLLTAMSNVTRVGVPLTRDDYSSVLVSIGLPPLPEAPPAHAGQMPGGPQPPHVMQHDVAGQQHKLSAAEMLLEHTQPPDNTDMHMAAMDQAHSAGQAAMDRQHEAGLAAGEQQSQEAQSQTQAMAGGGVVKGKSQGSGSKSKSKGGEGGSPVINLHFHDTGQSKSEPPVVNVSPQPVTVNMPQKDTHITFEKDDKGHVKGATIKHK